MIKNFDSRVTNPQVVFLGLNEAEKENALEYDSYVGTPYFALDVTPQGAVEKEAKGVIAEMEARGLSFNTQRTIMTISPEECMFASIRQGITYIPSLFS